MQKKRTAIFPVMLAGLALGAIAATPPRKVSEVKLPASFAEFYPSARNVKAQPVAPERPSFRNSAAKLAANSDIYGYLYYFQGTQLNRGFYRINDTPAPTFLWADYYTSEWSMNMTGGWIRDGKLCGINSMVFMGGLLGYGQIELDLKNGEVLSYRNLTVDATDVTNQYLTITYRDLDDRVYGYGYLYDGRAYGFKSAKATDIDTSEAVCEVPYEEVCTSLCYNVQDDAIYGINTQGDFVSVSPEGKQTAIMHIDIADMSPTVTGLTYSPKDNVYIYNVYYQDGNSAMYSIDPGAKSVTKLYDCPNGEEYIYLVCTAENAADEAPARPGIDSYNFSSGALDGSLTCTMPGRTMAGEPLSGNLDWRLYIDGRSVSSGSAPAGSKAGVEVRGLGGGEHTFAFSAGKDGVWSVPAVGTRWIGTDSPSAPTDVVLTADSVSWSPVTTSEHDGYVDYSAVTYVVTLNGAAVCETAETKCAVSYPVGKEYTSYAAEVIARAGGKSSQPGVSNFINYGDPIRIPENGALHYRPEEYQFPLFKAIDIDGKTDEQGNTRNWHYSETMGFPSFASGADGEDLLVFPPIMFDNTDHAYQFQMEAGLIRDIDKTGSIEVLLGKEPNLESMTRTVIPATKLQYMRGDIMTDYFSVPEPGVYYLGILTRTGSVAMHVSDMDIRLTDRAADVPQTVSDLSATAGENGALTATVTFTMPTLTVGGKALDPSTEIKARVTSREWVLDKPFDGKTIATVYVTGKPGEKMTAVVGTQQNRNTIGVSCTVDNRDGVETTTSLYTGLVRPYTVQNFKAEVSEDNMSVRLTWTPPVEGEEEGAIGDRFFYSVWYYSDGWTFYDGAGWDVNEFTVELDPSNPQTLLMLGVMAMNDAGQSDHIASATTIAGLPYELPVIEKLLDGEEEYSPIAIQRPGSDYQSTYWMVTDPAEVAAIFANKSGWAYVGYVGAAGATGGKSRLSLPKFSTVGCSDVKVTLSYWGGPYNAPFTLLSNVYGAQAPETVGSFPEGSGWIENTIVLPEKLIGLKWVELLLDSEFRNTNSFAMFSGYSITGTSGVVGCVAGEGSIYTTPGMLHVSGFRGERITVTDASGRVCVSVPEAGDMAGYALAPGLYIVKAGSESKTVMVR